MRNMVSKVLFCLVAGYSSASLATIFQYSDGPGSFGNGGTFDSIFASYNTSNSVLTWQVDNALKNGSLMDGFWLVLNNGPTNPKGDDGLAIFYADFVDSDGPGTADNMGLWAYEYNGQNSPNSYASTEFLGDLSAGLLSAGTTRGFSIDVSGIYSQLATAQPFDEMIGIWFHPNWGTSSTVNRGELTDWSYNSQSWYDKSGRPTVSIEPEPEPTISVPGTLALFMLGLLGVGLARFRKAV